MSRKPVPTQAVVDELLRNACANGFGDEAMDGAPRDIARDLIDFSTDCEHCTVDELEPLVVDFQKRAKREELVDLVKDWTKK